MACIRVFHWLHDVLKHPAAAKVPGVEVQSSWLAEAGQIEYLRLFFEKTALWGRYLMAQFLASGTFAISDMNAMQMEAAGIRSAHACSIPTDAALALLAKQGPLLEVGCGNGLWAKLLQERSADVVAYNSAEWDARYGEHGSGPTASNTLPLVKEGGPEKVKEHPTRTLVLMSPDQEGRGGFGAACLEAYQGERLALVGEWFGQTYGLQQPCGGSFSQECVQLVESGFELETQLPLPCWPLSLESLMIWRRLPGKPAA